jgi:hypothetical protein
MGDETERLVRPTPTEELAAREIIARMRMRQVSPPLIAVTSMPDIAVVACAIALFSGEYFKSDKQAKAAFGVGPSTNVRGLWIEDKLAKLLELQPGVLTADTVRPGSTEALPAASATETATAPAIPLARSDDQGFPARIVTEGRVDRLSELAGRRDDLSAQLIVKLKEFFIATLEYQNELLAGSDQDELPPVLNQVGLQSEVRLQVMQASTEAILTLMGGEDG